MSEDTAIERFARPFRAGIETCERRGLPLAFERFPLGACGDATPLLGTFLKERGFGSFTYMLGERGAAAEDTNESHAWLQRGSSGTRRYTSWAFSFDTELNRDGERP